jgi:putative transposase
MWSEPEMTFPHLRGVERSATPRRWGKRARFSGLMAFGHSWSLEVLKLTAPTMTKHQVQHDELTDGAINTLLQFGLADGLPRVAEMLLNAAMILERTAHIGAAPHQRSQDRNGYANGFKPRTYHSAIGKLDLRIPQTRDSDEPFRPSLLESGSRTDKALKAAIAEIYLGGTSTRKVSAVMEKLCGLEVTSTQVSRLTKELDETFQQWRERSLPEIQYLILDATYLKVRYNGAVRDCAVLIAIGVRRDDGRRMVLGVSTALSEAETHWRAFLMSLRERGIGLPDLVTSDAHEGLRAALRSALNATPWQRCQFHLQQNAQAHVPKVSMRAEVAADIRRIFNADSSAEARQRLEEVVRKYEKDAPKLARWLEEAVPEALTVFTLPAHVRKRLRTSNMAETLNTQIKRRTRVAALFPNEASALRLVTAVLMDISEEWETGKVYLNPNPTKTPNDNQ